MLKLYHSPFRDDTFELSVVSSAPLSGVHLGGMVEKPNRNQYMETILVLIREPTPIKKHRVRSLGKHTSA